MHTCGPLSGLILEILFSQKIPQLHQFIMLNHIIEVFFSLIFGAFYKYVYTADKV